MARPDLVAAAFHWVEYLGLLGAIGSLVVRRLGNMAPKIDWARPRPELGLVVAVTGIVGLAVYAPSSILARLDLAAVVHILAAGMWAGGILAMAALRPPGGWTSPEALALVERFGRVAVIAFIVTAGTGLVRASEQLRNVSDLWSTEYGVILSLKVAGVVVMLVLALLWRRGGAWARLDAAVAVLVVGLTALLAAFPVQA
jgi:copper transport protein